MANRNVKSDEMLEEFAVDDTGAFGRIRNVLKETGDMFLFGKPTPDILHIMIKLYHENIVKNLSFRNADNMAPQARGAFEDKNIGNLQFMCGIIQMNDNELYITISEAPTLTIGGVERKEDKLFEQKEKILDRMLKNCNIDVKYPERNSENEDPKTLASKQLAKTTFKTLSYDEKFKINWRHDVNGDPTANVLDPRIFPKSMKSNPDLTETDENKGGGKFNNFILNDHILIDQGNDSSTNYNTELWEKKYTVNMINSYQYLSKRMTEGKSFAPFKKYKYDDPSPEIECNNGSTCTESKLFSYVRNDLKKEFKDIKGFGVFWVANNLPQHHHIKGYCYSPWITEENGKLTKLRGECLGIIKGGEYKPEYINSENFEKVLKDVLQPVAMACPGCYSNYLKYTSGSMDTEWDQTGCYMEVSPRTARARARAAKREANKRKAALATRAGRVAQMTRMARTPALAATTAGRGGGARAAATKYNVNIREKEMRQEASNEAYAAAENNVYGNTFLNWGPNERAAVQRLRAIRARAIENSEGFITSVKGKHSGGNRTHKRRNQKRRNTRRLKRHHNV